MRTAVFVLLLTACGPDPEASGPEPYGHQEPVACGRAPAVPVRVEAARVCHEAGETAAWVTVDAQALLRARGGAWGEPVEAAPGPDPVRVGAPRGGSVLEVYVLDPAGDCWAPAGRHVTNSDC